MTDDRSYRFALLDKMEQLLDAHGRSIADLQERLAKYDVLYGQAITRLHERFDANDTWIKEVVLLLVELRDAVNKDTSP